MSELTQSATGDTDGGTGLDYCLKSLSKLVKATETPEGDWLVYGTVASENEDYDGETLAKAGIREGLKMFQKLGRHVDFEHQYGKTLDPNVVIGKGIEITELDGVPYLVTKLYKDKPLAKAVWDHINSGGDAGYSIEGVVKARDPKNRSHVLSTEIHRVTISLSPKGFDNRIKAGAPTSLFGVLKGAVGAEPVTGNGWRQAARVVVNNYRTPATGASKGMGGGGPVNDSNYSRNRGDDYSQQGHMEPVRNSVSTTVKVHCQNCDTPGSMHLDSPRPGLANCPKCGYKTRTELVGSRKAMTTGSGIVGDGDGGTPGDASPLRVQSLHGVTTGDRKAQRPGKRVKPVKPVESLDPAKPQEGNEVVSESKLERRLKSMGVRNSGTVAKAIALCASRNSRN